MPWPITIEVTHPTTLTRKWYYDKDHRSGFYFTTVIPGGDDACGFNIPCNDVVSGGLGCPPIGSTVRLFDTRSATRPFWIGRLKEPHFKIMNKQLKAINLVAQGFMHSAEDTKFLTNVSFGPVTTGSSPLSTKVVTTDIKDALIYALTQLCPDITIDLAQIATTGINLHADSQSFGLSYAIEVFNFFSSITAYLATPLTWQVYPDPATGLPTFRFWTIDTGVSYWDDGKSEQDLTYDIERVMNRATVQWGNNQRWTEPTSSGGPIVYTAFGGDNIIRDKGVVLQAEYQGLDDIKALAAGYLFKFNRNEASGNVTLTEDIRTPLDTTYGVTPPHRVRAGKNIRNELPVGLPYTDDTRFIVGTRWDEAGGSGDCDKVSLQFGELGGLYQEMRRLQTLPNGVINWSIDFATFGRPVPDLMKDLQLGSQWPSIPSTATSARIGAVIPAAAMTDGTHNYGPHGGQLLPEILPVRRMGPLQQFRTGDGSRVLVGDNVIRSIALDWKGMNRYKIVSKESATITVELNVNGVLKATISLVGAIASAIVTITAFTTVLGDVVTYDVTANDLSTDFTVMVFGEADHPEFPVYASPGV